MYGDGTDNKEKVMLYLIADKEVPGMLEYFRERGLNISKLFTDIGEARSNLLLQENRIRIVIIDSGTGRFVSTIVRKELVDLIGISDEDNLFTVFYTDPVIKSSVLNDLSKELYTIDWFKFTTTVAVVATMLKYKEEYIPDDDYDNILDIDVDSALKNKVNPDNESDNDNDDTTYTFSSIKKLNELIQDKNDIPGFKMNL